MHKVIQSGGFLLILMGVSGAIDHVAFQPIMGIVLNVINREVISRIGFLAGYELFANLVVAGIGLAICVVAEPRRS